MDKTIVKKNNGVLVVEAIPIYKEFETYPRRTAISTDEDFLEENGFTTVSNPLVQGFYYNSRFMVWWPVNVFFDERGEPDYWDAKYFGGDISDWQKQLLKHFMAGENIKRFVETTTGIRGIHRLKPAVVGKIEKNGEDAELYIKIETRRGKTYYVR